MSSSRPPFRILAIDGGGIRGIIPALVLAEIEERAQAPIAALFDLLVGTSTGGILALGLAAARADGGPQFSAAGLSDLYEAEASRIFAPWATSSSELALVERLAGELEAEARLRSVGERVAGKPPSWLHALFHPKYTAESLETLLRQRFGAATLSRPVDGLHVAVTSYDVDQRRLQVFRSWEAQASPADDFPLWQVARATSAAPVYFPVATLTSVDGSRTLNCVDGGICANDPAVLALGEARLLGCERAPTSGPPLLVSVGTGQPSERALPFAAVRQAGVIGWLAHGLLDLVFDGGAAAVEGEARELSAKGLFYRLQASLGGADTAMDDWSADNLAALKATARELLARERATIDAIVRRLGG